MNERYKVSIPFDTIDKKHTHRGNETKHVIKDLKLSITNRDIDVLRQKSVELHVSGMKYLKKWMEVILCYYFSRIHKYIPVCTTAVLYFIKEVRRLEAASNYDVANSQSLRNFIFYINWIICQTEPSKESPLYAPLKMTADDYDMSLLRKNSFIVSHNLDKISAFLHPSDPREIIVPLSEISTLLSSSSYESRDFKLCYWMSWIIHYEKVYHKGKLRVHMRQWNEEFAIGGGIEIFDDWMIIVFQLVVYYSKTYPAELKRTIQILIQAYVAEYNGKKNKIQYSIAIAIFRWMTKPADYPAIEAELITNANAHASTCNYSYEGMVIIDP